MPAVLITGLNGFVAVHTALKFLAEGWDVVGTVRSAPKGDATLALPRLAPYAKEGRVRYVLVEDLIEGDFTEGLKQVDAVAHCASPWHMNGKTWAEYRDPAVQGTTRIMQQAVNFPNIKAFNIISSFAAVGPHQVPFWTLKGQVYNEDDWMPETEQDAENAVDHGDGKAQKLWYCASKTLAERAAYALVEKVKPHYTLATLNPPMIFGPSYHYGSAKGIESSDVATAALWASTVAGADKTVPDTPFIGWCDVRDVADAFYETVVRRSEGRFVLAGGVFDYDTIAEIAERSFPELQKAGAIPKHLPPGQNPLIKGGFSIDTRKATAALGIHFKTLEESVKASVEQFEELGAVVKTA